MHQHSRTTYLLKVHIKALGENSGRRQVPGDYGSKPVVQNALHLLERGHLPRVEEGENQALLLFRLLQNDSRGADPCTDRLVGLAIGLNADVSDGRRVALLEGLVQLQVGVVQPLSNVEVTSELKKKKKKYTLQMTTDQTSILWQAQLKINFITLPHAYYYAVPLTAQAGSFSLCLFR